MELPTAKVDPILLVSEEWLASQNPNLKEKIQALMEAEFCALQVLVSYAACQKRLPATDEPFFSRKKRKEFQHPAASQVRLPPLPLSNLNHHSVF